MVILGKVPVNDEVSFRFGSIMGEKRIARSSYGGARPMRDFPWLAELYLQGQLALDELITQRVTASTPAAAERFANREALLAAPQLDLYNPSECSMQLAQAIPTIAEFLAR